MSVTYEQAQLGRDLGLQKVEDHADADWKDLAWSALVDFLRSHEEFFVDDFWTATQLDPPRESRALGPIVLRASRQGLMVKSGRSRPSVRSHLSDKPVWTSLIYGEAA